MAHATHILSFGYDPILLPLRSMVLRSRGYAVEEAYSLAEAFRVVQSDVIDLMLICHTVPADDQNKLIASVRSVRRLLPILCITDQEFAAFTEGCFAVTNSPLDLLDAVRLAASPEL
jgi:DNA-binding response OmpR family regulator